MEGTEIVGGKQSKLARSSKDVSSVHLVFSGDNREGNVGVGPAVKYGKDHNHTKITREWEPS